MKIFDQQKVWRIISIVALLIYIISIYMMYQDARSDAENLAAVQLETVIRSNLSNIENGNYRALGESVGPDLNKVQYDIHFQNKVFSFGEKHLNSTCSETSINLANKENIVRWCRPVVFPYKTVVFVTGLIGVLVIFAFASIKYFEKTTVHRFSTLLAGVGVNLPVNIDLRGILQNIEDLKNQLFHAQQKEVDLAKNAAIGQIARQVAHDIRSPIGALQLALLGPHSLPEDRKKLAEAAILRVNKIADDLLQKSKPDSIEVFDASTAINELVLEKNLSLSAKHIISLDIAASAQLQKISKSELQRILSNLINNSAEAMPRGGEIKVSTRKHKNLIEIIISDFGCGIPSEVLEKLGAFGVTYGKHDLNSGSGLGVANAFKIIRQVGGDIRISSKVGEGTMITLQLPC